MWIGAAEARRVPSTAGRAEYVTLITLMDSLPELAVGLARSSTVPLAMEATTPQGGSTTPAGAKREPSPMYRTAMAVCRPVAIWGRLKAEGVEALPESGPALVVGNHDSHWDPVMVGISAIKRRQIKALAKSDLWKVRGLAPVLDGMGQIPIERDAGDAGALARAVEELRHGSCIGVFPEGTRSRGKVLRRAQRHRPPGARGPRGEDRLRRDRGDLGPDRLSPSASPADPLLRAAGGTGQARGAGGRARGPAVGRDPRAGPTVDLRAQARLGLVACLFPVGM